MLLQYTDDSHTCVPAAAKAPEWVDCGASVE